MIVVLTLQASLAFVVYTQGYTVCWRKRLTLGYGRYALPGLMVPFSPCSFLFCPIHS